MLYNIMMYTSLRPRYECAILPMVAGGNLLTVMAPAAQHTRSFLFAHNCDEETALFGERAWAALSALHGTCGKSEALRNNANYGGRCKCKRGERAAGCADSERAGHPNLTAKKNRDFMRKLCRQTQPQIHSRSHAFKREGGKGIV